MGVWSSVVGSLRFDVFYTYRVQDISDIIKNELIGKVDLIFNNYLPSEFKRFTSLRTIRNDQMPVISLNISARIPEESVERRLINWLTRCVDSVTKHHHLADHFIIYQDGIVRLRSDSMDLPRIAAYDHVLKRFKMQEYNVSDGYIPR